METLNGNIMTKNKRGIKRVLEDGEEQTFVVPMALDELNKIFGELKNEWMQYVIEAVDAEDKIKMGDLAECKPPWYSTDYLFREDVIAENLRLAYEYKLNNK